jgi:hypothetical protein
MGAIPTNQSGVRAEEGQVVRSRQFVEHVKTVGSELRVVVIALRSPSEST